MRSFNLHLHLPAIIACIAILFVSAYGYRVSFEASNALYDLNDENIIERAKRQIEDLDTDDYTTAEGNVEPEESDFWDRVVKVALKLFSRFIEWLNSS